MNPVFEPLAEDALLLRFGNTIDPALNAQALALAARLRQENPPWLRDVVSAYASLAVFFDCRRIESNDPHAFVTDALRAQLEGASTVQPPACRLIEIPVCYEADLAPDLQRAADELGIGTEELIDRHCGADYRVAMIGFAPGFPYLLGLPDSLALPRLATPRKHVPAGSVAIGGNQAGIYPRASPGGWRLLGRTPLQLFEPASESPSLLAPGDRVRFQRIDHSTFLRLQSP